MSEHTIVLEFENFSEKVRAEKVQAQRIFNLQWSLADLPACDEGMILLKLFHDRHPGTYELLRQGNFVKVTHPLICSLPHWKTFADHVSGCPKCNSSISS